MVSDVGLVSEEIGAVGEPYIALSAAAAQSDYCIIRPAAGKIYMITSILGACISGASGIPPYVSVDASISNGSYARSVITNAYLTKPIFITHTNYLVISNANAQMSGLGANGIVLK